MLAPMAGITDWPFRLRCQQLGADVLVSEMISAMGLLQAPKDSRVYQDLLAHHPAETTLIAQLFGKEPEMMGEAAAILHERPYYHGIDINFGCPAPKVTGSGSGSALMKNLPLAAKIVNAVRASTSKPLSAKMRLGWDHDSINAVDFALMCQDQGVDSLCVHGRTRAMQYSGRADWDMIAKVKQAVSIPVFANGDVFAPEDGIEIIKRTGADGIAIGRGALGNPWLFQQVKQALAGQEPSIPSNQQKQELALTHLADMVAYHQEAWAIVEMRKHFGWYLKGSPGAAASRAKINQAKSLAELISLVNAHFDGIQGETVA